MATSPSGMKVLQLEGVPYTDEMIANAKADLERQVDPNAEAVKDFLARYPKAQVRQFDGDPSYRVGARCADRLSADAGHAGRLRDVRRRRSQPEVRTGHDL